MAITKAPLVLQVTLHVRGSQNGDLRDGDPVVSGDHMQVSILTSEDAHLWLAYCTKNRDLDVFPLQGSIRTKAGEVTLAPDKTASIVLDDNTGREALYAILSRVDLESAGQRLVKAIAASGPGGVAADCGERHPVAPRRRSADKPPRSGYPTLSASSEPDKPIVRIERGAEVVWNGTPGVAADADGIAILRYGLQHVAARLP